MLAPGEGMSAKAADRRCRERPSASEPISGRKARATITGRVSAASDVRLSPCTPDTSEPRLEFQGKPARQRSVVLAHTSYVYGKGSMPFLWHLYRSMLFYAVQCPVTRGLPRATGP